MRNRTNIKTAGVLLLLASAVMAATGGCGKNVTAEPTEEADSVIEDITPKEESEAETEESAQEPSAYERPVTVVSHTVSCEEDGVVYANGCYDEVILSGDYAAAYPELVEYFEETNEDLRESVCDAISDYAVWAKAYDSTDEFCYFYNLSHTIARADDTMFTIRTVLEDYSGGAHPNISTGAYTLTPQKAENLPLRDILEDPDSFGELVMDELEAWQPEVYEDVISYFSTDGSNIFDDKLAEDTCSWSLGQDGLTLYFSPYEVASYATGAFTVDLYYEIYPELIKPEYVITDDSYMNEMIGYVEGDPVDVAFDQAAFDEMRESIPVQIKNPTWNRYLSDSATDQATSLHTLTKVNEQKSDWLDTEAWAAAHGFELPMMPYSDDEYYYHPTYTLEYDYMYAELEIYTADGQDRLYYFDFYPFCIGPDEESYTYADVQLFIHWAQIKDGILYVSIGHNGYAYEEPDANFILAIDLETNELLWKSQSCTCNSANFMIVDDTIICGYGFTAEPDYLYLLNRYTGEITDTIAINSAASHFVLEGDVLYVATYNTAYEFQIN